MTQHKVLLVGIDAACFEQLDPLIAAGEVPTIESLISRGIDADIETTFPPWTPSAWPSVVTGVEPWRHGIYDFHHYGDGDPRLVTARDVRVPFLWEVLSEHGHPSIVVNVPVTHPVHAFDGSLVPGYLAPEGTTVLVDGAERNIADILPDYTVYGHDTDSAEARITEYERMVDSRVDAALRLAREHPWEFMMVQFQAPDSVFHTDGTDDDALARVYRRVDAGIERLLAETDEDCYTILVSDHGIHQYERVVYLNTWLRERGDLVTSSESERHVWNEQEKHTAMGDERGTSARFLDGALRGLSRVGLTPARAERLLARVGLDETVSRLLPESMLLQVVDASEYVDIERSRAYCRSLSSLGVRCNVEGRDPDGVVPASEFEAFRTDLIADLRALRGPDGSAVFEAVEDRHALVGSDVANEASAPDILLRPAGMTWKVSDIVRERVFGDTDEFSHTWNGLVVATGPGIESFDRETLSVVDVAPTVLALFGIDATDLDGNPMFTVCDDIEPLAVAGGHDRKFFDGVDNEQTDGPGDEDDADFDVVQDRLKQMGYLE